MKVRAKWSVAVGLSVIFLSMLMFILTSKESPVSPAASIPQAGVYLLVDVSDQTLSLYREGQKVHEYAVSTSRYGTGSKADSNRTPLGRHRIAQKIGDGAPLNTIFKNRRSVGALAEIRQTPDSAKEDYITSRIMWLEGLEEGVNKGPGIDSFQRFIYIHGTADEGLIGQPASHGCVRMKNLDVVDLFKVVLVGTRVDIRL